MRKNLFFLAMAVVASPAFGQPNLSQSVINYGNAGGGGGGGGSGCTFANPTATAGDTAVNGSASTCMRSDAAPAVQKGSSSQFGIVKVDGSTITATGGVISAPGGSGTVTNVATGACLTGGPVTTTGTISGTYVNRAVTTTSDTILSSDACKIVTYSNASAIAVSLPQATGSFGAGFSFDTQNLGAGLVTITPTTSTINGAASFTVPTNTGCTIWSDGTNWQVSACPAVMLNTTNTWNARQGNCTKTLTISGSTFTPDGSCNNYKIVLVHASCPCTLANPSVDITGADGRIQIIQSSTGNDAITTWGSNYKISGGTSAITLSTAANAIDLFSVAGISSTEDDLVGPSTNLVH